MVYAALLGLGKLILNQTVPGLILCAVAIASAVALNVNMSRSGWSTEIRTPEPHHPGAEQTGAVQRDPTLARDAWRRLEAIHAVTYFAPEATAAMANVGYKGFWMGYFGCRA